MDDLLLNLFFIVAAIIIVTLVLSRILVRRRVTKMMMDKSDHHDLEESNNSSIGEEVPAPHTPVITMVDFNSDLAEAVIERNKLIAGAKKVFRRALYVDLLAALGYLFIPSLVLNLIYWIFNPDTYRGTIDIPIFIALPLAFISLIRYFAFKNEFKVYHKGIIGFVQPIKRIWLTIADPKWRGYYTIAAISAVILLGFFHLSFSLPEGLAFFSAAAFHFWLVVRLRKSLRKERNIKLLILRVFGIDETATFTFEGLLHYWQYFGSFFTIVDPSFLRSSVRQRNQIIPAISLAFLLLIILGVVIEESDLDPEISETYVKFLLIPLVTLLGFIYIRFSIKSVDKSFILGKEDLDSRLAKLDKSPRKLNYVFKSMPTMCYDNTWKIAVSEFANKSDLILMDLRGFSEERKGCEYEVDFLFDQVPVSKIVFLINPNGFELTEKLILERWAMQHPGSPNLNIPKPELQVYVSSKENNKDIQGIMDVLMNKVAKQA